MTGKRKLRRIHVQSGCTDRMHRPIEGVFVVELDEDDMVAQMERAANNKTRQSCSGPLIVTYHPSSKAESDWIAEHPELVSNFRRA